MKQILIFSIIAILFIGISDQAFADVTIVPAAGSGAPGCEDTSSGCYLPSTTIVNVGERVIFSNTDSAAHTFTSSDGNNNPDGKFDSSLVMAGSTFEWTPTVAVDVPYFCMVHPWMQGLIILVTEIEPAETISVNVYTNKNTYSAGETIIVTGTVGYLLQNIPITLVVTSPENSIVDLAQITVGNDKEFKLELLVGDSSMNGKGTYTISAKYGADGNSGQTTFYYSIPETPTYPSSAPYGTDVIIPRDTDTPGCENSNSCYSPYRITIDEGDTITWYNADSAIHTVTSGTPSNGPTGVFDSGAMNSGESYSSKIYSSGTYDYFCMVHPWMQGIVSVNKAYTPPTYTPPTSDSGKIDVSGISVSYSITGGKLQAITPDIDAKILIISIDATNDGSITLTLPRTLIDAKRGGSDDSFYVLVDGEEISFDEKTMSSARIVTMSFPRGAEELEIVGTKIINTTPTYTPPSYTPPTYTPPVTIPPGMNIVIPSGTGSPGCENTNSCYEPRTFSAGKYSTITWFNSDSAAHTVTSGTPGNGPDGNFDSGLFMSGASFSHRFNDDGTYPYFCMVHPWMEGKVSITRSGATIEAPTTYTPPTTPTPTPTTLGSISVYVDDSQYSPSDLVTVKVSASKITTVAISVIGPNQDSVVSRSVSTDSSGSGSLQFKLPESSQNGSYRIDSTATISGNKVSDSVSFTVKSTTARISIASLQPTDQQGNVVSSFTKGKLGFAKIILSSDSSASSLVTINLFDSDLTSLGIGSFKTTLSSGESEMTLSFFIPNDAEFGIGDIYANVFSDWPSQGGVPLTGESATQVRIQ